MIKEIVTDKEFLSRQAEALDLLKIINVISDLTSTALENRKNCAGLAANQIGSLQPIFVMRQGCNYVPIVDPVVKAISKEIKADFESCLSLPGERKRVRRHKCITIQYINAETQEIVVKKFKDKEARIIQHEMDHLRGVLI